VRLFRNGADWTQRSPKIAEAALKIRATHFAIDGERVMRGSTEFPISAMHSKT
jgi:ATP-dependent DNA ligase